MVVWLKRFRGNVEAPTDKSAAGEGAVCPKFVASVLKSSAFTFPSPLKSPVSQLIPVFWKFDATIVKSAEFTTPFKSASAAIGLIVKCQVGPKLMWLALMEFTCHVCTVLGVSTSDDGNVNWLLETDCTKLPST